MDIQISEMATSDTVIDDDVLAQNPQSPHVCMARVYGGEVGFRASTTGLTAVQRKGILGAEGTWWTLGDLNPRPSGCKPDDLPG